MKEKRVKKLKKMDSEILSKRAELADIEKFIFSDEAAKLKEKEYNAYFSKMLKEKKELDKLRSERRALFLKVSGYSEIPKDVNTSMMKSLVL